MSTKVVKRKKNGHFAKGTAPGPGNPLVGKMQRMKAMVLDCSSPNQVKRVMKALLAAAEGGDVQAMKLWLDWNVGKPSHLYDPRQGMPSQEAGDQQEEIPLRDQLMYYRGAAAACEAQLRQQQQQEDEVDDG
jgi:hypothetical protein